MNQQGKVAEVGGHEHSPFELLLPDDRVYLIPNL